MTALDSAPAVPGRLASLPMTAGVRGAGVPAPGLQGWWVWLTVVGSPAVQGGVPVGRRRAVPEAVAGDGACQGCADAEDQQDGHRDENLHGSDPAPARFLPTVAEETMFIDFLP